ncbi:MAG: SAM-dependent methyltransferase [Lachnospiraceae bacterium]|jgi:tRNA (adenine22-N1)-methyltransferase|nr:SAM-dependent methyltransferase [Lachnospiraceae bacterium]
MKGGQVTLSRRLQMLADMVTPGNRVADVGCDHGFLSVFLVQRRISPHVLAMDVRKGPLAAAAGHVEECGLGAYIETRLSDGLLNLAAGEADTLVCAGMGGRLMQRILAESMEKAGGLKELILQPQSELGAFRRFLRREGFRIVGEDAVCEEGKYYFAMKAVPGGGNPEAEGYPECAEKAGQNRMEGRQLFDEYGELLLRQRHPVLHQYLLFQEEILIRLREGLEAENTKRTAGRLEEISREQAQIRLALKWFEENGSTV